MKRLPRTLLAFGLLLWLTGAARPDYIFTTLDGVIATGINDSGDIVGGYTAGSYLYSGGSYTRISVPGRLTITDAQGINNAGQIVGYYGDDSGLHGFLLSGGSYTRIDVPGSFRTFAYGINNAGQIVGTYQVGGDTGPELGFLLSGGAFSTIGFRRPGSMPSTTAARSWKKESC